MAPPFKSLFDAKAMWRERLMLLRDDAAKKRPGACQHAARNFLDSIDPRPGQIVSLYLAMRSELDAAPLMKALIERGAEIALPVVAQKKTPLVFRRYRPGEPLAPGAYGEEIPLASAPTVTPDIVVCPLLGFTRSGDRLGYGGGYYDRTLQSLRAAGAVTAVGYAFAAQEVDGLPVSPLDQPLDWIVTERGAHFCAGG